LTLLDGEDKVESVVKNVVEISRVLIKIQEENGRLSKFKSELDERSREVEGKESQIENAFEQRKRKVEEKEKELEDRNRGIFKEQEELKKLRQQKEEDFKTHLDSIVQKELAEVKKGLLAEREEFNADAEQRRRKLVEAETDLGRKLEQFEEEFRKLQEERLKIQRERLDFKIKLAEANGPEDTAVATLKAKSEAWEKRRSELQDEIKELQARLDSTLSFLSANGKVTYQDLVAKYQGLHKEFNALRDHHRGCHESAGTFEKMKATLVELKRQRDDANRSVQDLEETTGRLQGELAKAASSAKLVETLKIAKSAVETELDELNKRLDEVKTKDRPFRSLELLDRENQAVDSGSPLKSVTADKFFKDVERSLSNADLIYPENLLRSFFAGLAVSRLVLLEGPSGTGKTTLPLAFAHSVGAEFSVVSVQAGWRSRSDLIGYFNDFEGKYVETEFFRALYSASLPKNRDRMFFVILDEMNLSHPEHYFADVLSAMENREKGQGYLALCDSARVPADKVPKRLESHQGGFRFKLPDNLWFIGTANQDETTVRFAPKTYNRAHTMRFPMHSNKKPSSKNPERVGILASEDFAKLGEKALSKNGADIVTWRKKLDGLENEFRALELFFSPRLEGQFARYVALFAESGGDFETCVDLFVRDKILNGLEWHAIHHSDKKPLAALRENLEKLNLKDSAAYCHSKISESFLLGEEGES